jgi:predicted ATPase with chaperone activity
MLAWQLTTILPAMSLAEAIDTTRLPHVASRIGEGITIVTRVPEGPAPPQPR